MNLQLSLKTKWFEMTKEGIKTEDYREITPYWTKRLTQIDKDEDIEKVAEQLNRGLTYYLEQKERNKYFGLEGHLFPKKFTQNTMTLGYPPKGDSDRILKLEHKGIEIRTGNPEWGAEPEKLYFVIKHGSILA